MSASVRKPAHTLAAAAAGVLLIAGIAVGVVGGGVEPTAVPPVPRRSATTGPAPTESAGPDAEATDPLTGGKLSRNEVIAVKVENIAAARPQVGLHAADIVFAEEVEGGQTRLVAVYHSRFPKAVEPVRSARSTDAQLLPLFGKPGLVYSGANARVQRKLDNASIVPIYNATRDPRRVAPHNVRVNLKRIADRHKVGRAEPIGWRFASSDERVSNAKKARIARSKVGNDTFTFTAGKGRYTVRWNGSTYEDGDSGTVTTCDNVVVMRVRNVADGNRDVNGSASVMSETVGDGKVTVFRDGRVLSGTWSRGSASAPLRFRDSRGEDIPLAPGRTWVTLQG